MFTRLTLPWTWLNTKSKYLGFDMFARPTLPHSIGHAKGGWSFSLACPKENVHSFGCARGLTHCQTQSRPGLVSAKPSVPGTWHVAKPNAPSLEHACFPENLYL